MSHFLNEVKVLVEDTQFISQWSFAYPFVLSLCLKKLHKIVLGYTFIFHETEGKSSGRGLRSGLRCSDFPWTLFLHYKVLFRTLTTTTLRIVISVCFKHNQSRKHSLKTKCFDITYRIWLIKPKIPMHRFLKILPKYLSFGVRMYYTNYCTLCIMLSEKILLRQQLAQVYFMSKQPNN